MFAQKFIAGLRKPFGGVYPERTSTEHSRSSRGAQARRGKEKRSRQRIDPQRTRVDLVTEQVKKVLQTSDQKLILMVRG